jgi:hypothetical protein
MVIQQAQHDDWKVPSHVFEHLRLWTDVENHRHSIERRTKTL